MPYVAQVPPDHRRQLATGAARWEALAAARHDLEPAVALQRRLVTVQLDLLDALERSGVPGLSLPPRYLAAKLGRSVPAFAGEPVTLPVSTLRPALFEVCTLLETSGAGDAARHVMAALTEGNIDAASLLSASFTRDRRAVLLGATHRGLSPDLVWLAAELVTGPLAHLLGQRVLTAAADSELGLALARWSEGYCPACGSWPALAEHSDRRDVLRCSFCGLAWMLDDEVCVYCGGSDVAVTLAEGSGDRALLACRTCGGYLKRTPVDRLTPFPLLTIGDLETAGLDVVAMEQGYRRPDLREFTFAR